MRAREDGADGVTCQSFGVFGGLGQIFDIISCQFGARAVYAGCGDPARSTVFVGLRSS